MNRDEAIELKNSLNWQVFVKELEAMATMEVENLIKSTENDQMLRHQERVKVYRQVIRLPDIIAEREA